MWSLTADRIPSTNRATPPPTALGEGNEMTRRSRRGVGLAAGLVTVALAVPALPGTADALTVTAATGPGVAVPSVPSDVRAIRTVRSLLGEHRWYQQYALGYPVVGGYYAVHAADSGAVTIDDERVPADRLRLALPTVTQRISRGAAVESVTGRPQAPAYLASGARGLWLLPAEGDRGARLVWQVRTATGKAVAFHYVDAAGGDVLAREQVSASAGPVATRRGVGRVLDPNPVVSLQDESLRDHRDDLRLIPYRGYRVVTLKHLQSRTLTGRWVTITNRHKPTRPKLRFKYRRGNGKFEMVNAYYAVDTAQSYLRSLGFDDVNAERQQVQTNAFPYDNSYYDSSVDKMSFGRGGVDDAEDVEVVWHEYGHAIQDAQVPGYGTTEEAGAIGEGFGDYFAVTMSQRHSPDTAVTPLACVADWDATSYTPGTTPHCLRRTDGTKIYPDDLRGQVHADGEIWSRALWDINQSLGRKTANRLIIEAQFSFTRGIGFVKAAQRTVAAARDLSGDEAADIVQQAFADRGILPPPT